jgi:hypothetical protein
VRSAEVKALEEILGAADRQVRQAGDVLHEKPKRPGRSDSPVKETDHFQAFARWLVVDPPGPRKFLTGRTADNPLGHAGNRVKGPHVAAVNEIRAANNAKAYVFESAAEEVNTRKEGQHQAGRSV